ncbi:hypothetical protein DFH29DRAFT_208477 [Suillus ampliporus]|nr:hypothetical protein DFH29DRAFT_208477 [Suillus ampliporus]
MSSLLSKSFDTLKIATPQQTGYSIRRPFKLVRPKRQPHLQFYGYAVSPEWLIQFAQQHWSEALPDRNAKNYEDIAMTRAYELISGFSGIYNLDRKDCFNPKGGSVPLEWIAVYDGDYDDELDDDELEAIQIDIVHVLTVCSDEEDEFEERPTQEKMDFMTKLIGHGPQWWMGCMSTY